MAQLSLYLEDEALAALRDDAARSGVSISRYARDILSARREGGGWPQGYFSLYGALSDDIGFELPDDEPVSAHDISPLEVDRVSA